MDVSLREVVRDIRANLSVVLGVVHNIVAWTAELVADVADDDSLTGELGRGLGCDLLGESLTTLYFKSANCCFQT